jgi:topoisomerase-4 subunit B
MNTRYNAADIEVLSGLEPVKRRPGMYTDTARPNHLAQEVIDNAVDEALAGHAKQIDVILHATAVAKWATTAAACRSTSTRTRRFPASN